MVGFYQSVADELRKDFAGILSQHPPGGSEQLILRGLKGGEIAGVTTDALINGRE
jgi:hypothetical protein